MLAKRPKRLLSALRAAFRIVLFLSPLLFGFLPPALAIETIAKQAFLIDMTTGEVLFEKNADQPMAPASMSKMMTAYMIFERLRDGSLTLEDTFTVSENAWRKGGAKSGGSTMFLERSGGGSLSHSSRITGRLNGVRKILSLRQFSHRTGTIFLSGLIPVSKGWSLMFSSLMTQKQRRH